MDCAHIAIEWKSGSAYFFSSADDCVESGFVSTSLAHPSCAKSFVFSQRVLPVPFRLFLEATKKNGLAMELTGGIEKMIAKESFIRFPGLWGMAA